MSDTTKLHQIEQGFTAQRELLEETHAKLTAVEANAHLLPDWMRDNLREQQVRNAHQLEQLEHDISLFNAWKAAQ